MFETNESAKFGRTVHWIWEATGDYVTIEKGKDGKFFNSKYEGKLVRYARPHVLCFSNQPPDLTMLSADRYHVIQLGVDLAMDRVAPAVEAAPEQPAMQWGGGAGSGKVVVLLDSDDDDDDTNNDN